MSELNPPIKLDIIILDEKKMFKVLMLFPAKSHLIPFKLISSQEEFI